MTTLDRPVRPARTPAQAQRGPRTPARAPRASASAAGARQEMGALSYYLVAGSALLLVALGVVMVLSASTIESIRDTGNPYAAFLGQLEFVLIGIPLAFVASRVPVAWYRRLAWPAFLATLGAQLLIFTPLARSQGGNVNWIYLPGVGQTVQPSEFLKLGLALWLGLVLARKGRLLATDWKHALVPGLLGAGAAIALVLAGHDLGTVLVMVALVAGAYFVAGLPLRWYAVAGVLGAGAAAFMVVISPSRTTRVMTFLGLVESDPTGSGFQTQHGLWGLGTGGISGVGLGASREKWSYLPEAHNDFIFAIIGEELGLLGTLLVLVLFGVLAAGMFRIVRRHQDGCARITTAAIATWILSQALVNIGVVIGVVPVIGVPLPLVSAGGSAMISTLVAIGVVLAFARSEPGAAAALAARRGVVARSLAVIGTRGRRG